MTLKVACEIGLDCGLETTGEAVMNIDMHSMSVFCYDKIEEELIELYGEYAKIKNIPIKQYLEGLK